MACIASVAAAALMVLQFSPLAARMSELPGEPAARLLVKPDEMTDRGMLRLIASREAARAWSADPTIAKSLGLIYLTESQRHSPEPGSQDHLIRNAVEELRTGLARAPGDAPAWTQLAMAHAMLGEDAEAVEALRLSFVTGTNFATLSPLRGQLGLLYYTRLDRDSQIALASDFRRMVRQTPRGFALVTRQLGLADLVVQALKDDPDLLDRFQRALFM